MEHIILNQSSVDRGLFRSTFYRTYKEEERKVLTSNKEEKFTKPDLNNTKGIKPCKGNRDRYFTKSNTNS